MSIIQISKIQQRSGDLVDLPQLDEAELGFASDTKQLFIGKESPNENIEVLTAYSQIAFDQIEGGVGNLDIDPLTVANGQVMTYDGTNWINRGGDAGGLIDLGGNANVKLSGGAIGYVLTTDGTGNLIWSPKTTIIGYIKNVSATDTGVLTTTSNVEFVNDSLVTISGIIGNTTSNIGSVLNGNSYYLQVVTPNTFQLFTGAGGSGNVDLTGLNFPYSTVSATSSTTDRITAASTNGFAEDDPIIFVGNTNQANTGIVANVTYFVDQIINSTTFTIKETISGATLEIGTNAGGWAGCEVYSPGGQAVSLVTSGAGNVGAASTDTTIQYNKNNILGGSASFTYDYNASILALTGNANINGNVNVTGNVLGSVFVSSVANGTAPITVLSSTKVANLNADLIDGYDTSISAAANTAVVRDGNSNIFAGNVYANTGTIGALTLRGEGGNISNITAANITGQVANALVAGTVYTNAQPNITSVGTLTGLNVNGNIVAANITANTGIFTGNGSGLSALNASNITVGTLAQARLANSSLTVNGVSISLGGSGTITANVSQNLTFGSFLVGTPNATYNGGTATSVAVDATSTNTASKVVARDSSGNFSAGTITATLSGAATTAGTVTTASQPNITSVGTLVSLAVTGNVSAANFVGNLVGNMLTSNITTGANTTPGTITGNWTLTTGSRLQATYADLAEYYAADKNYPAGTVLEFGGDKEVTLAKEESIKVAGVVSSDPAYVMNGDIQTEFPVIIALIGRVKVKVKGWVSKGDMLVSAGNGFAKTSIMTPKMGTVIGKAIENKTDSGEGYVEVMVGRI